MRREAESSGNYKDNLRVRTVRTRENLKVRSATLVKMTHGRGLRFDVLKGGLALGASALRLAAGAANQFDVTDDSVGAQMRGDGEIVDGADRPRVFGSLFGHLFP